jgi:nucleotide-binding universal stress UspA family protein
MGSMVAAAWQKPQLVIVVGIDFSRESESALETACGVARGIGRADIHAVYGASLAPLPYSLEAFAIAPQLDVAEERRRLDEICARAAAGQRIVRHVVLAAADRAIVSVAVEQHADLIVIGAHGKSALNRLVTGSVVDRIVRTAPCSVLVTREKKEHHVDARHAT